MKKFVLDTNIYIAAARDASFGAELIQFVASFLPQLYLHAVVVQDLARGAIQPRARRLLHRDIVSPFEKRGRVVVPTFRSWKRSGEIVAELLERKVLSVAGVPRSLLNDAMLASSCVEQGLTVITLNEADFRRIAIVEQVSYAVPWPRG